MIILGSSLKNFDLECDLMMGQRSSLAVSKVSNQESNGLNAPIVDNIAQGDWAKS